MGVGYYDALLPVRELGEDRAGMVAGLDLPCRAVGSVAVPGGRIAVAFVSDSARLARMFADNWADAGTGQEADATLYALTRPACSYGLDDRWDQARWWSRDRKAMVVAGFGSYRLAKVCVRGICSAVSADDIVFLHGCALWFGHPDARRGVVVTGSSGAGKTTLVARLIERAGDAVHVINDDWGAVSLTSGVSVNTGERMLHMKTGSVLALRPDFFARAPRDSYSYDLTEADRSARLLVSPDSVYGGSWNTGGAVITNVAVVVREAPGWVPPDQDAQAITVLKSAAHSGYLRHHEAFFNGSLILTTASDEQRETRHYERLLDRVTVSWINNCGTPGTLADSFLSAVMT